MYLVLPTATRARSPENHADTRTTQEGEMGGQPLETRRASAWSWQDGSREVVERCRVLKLDGQNGYFYFLFLVSGIPSNLPYSLHIIICFALAFTTFSFTQFQWVVLKCEVRVSPSVSSSRPAKPNVCITQRRRRSVLRQAPPCRFASATPTSPTILSSSSFSM